MLSPTERDRLKNRKSKDMDSQIKASNDARARRKLAMWLKEDLDDVLLIVSSLRNDRLSRVLTDKNAYDLLRLAELILSIKDFHPITGVLGCPEEWKVFDRIREEERPANDMDIKRAFRLYIRLCILKGFYETPGSPNPISSAGACSALLNDPELKDRVTDNDKLGIERISKANMIRDKEKEASK